jgi:hypothetical protein
MSLMDEFLLDPYPLDVWIAARTDGVLGSGTEDDPYNGSTASPPSVSITSITRGIPITSITWSGGFATITTSVNHGFSNGVQVQVENVVPGGYNGIFTITYVSANSFYYSVANPGTVSTPGDCRLAGTNQVTATTGSPHGFSSNDLILIDGATPSYYNGSFVIFVSDSTHFLYFAWGWPSGAATGTITCQRDPYQFDAVMRAMPTSLTRISNYDGTNRTNLATVLAYGHNFATNDYVLISGATGTDGQYYNGRFQITALNNDAFQYTMTGVPGADAQGALWARLSPSTGIVIPSSRPTPMAVRLGPGTFETRGYNPIAVPPSSRSWSPQSGMKILGSGIDVSLMKLVRAVIDNNANDYTAIGSETPKFLDSFAASDFTIDSNVAGQPSQLVACGAIAAYGMHSRLRRIRAINFGTQVPFGTSYPGAPFVECFVMTLGGAGPFDPVTFEPVDCWILDCITEQPWLNNTVTTSVMGVTGSESGELMVYHRAGGIRNCLIDLEYRDRPVQIAAINVSSGVATVTTNLAHGRNTVDYVRISGAILNGDPNSSFNGTYGITYVNDFNFSYTPSPAQGNTAPTGEMWVGKFPSSLVQITGITSAAAQAPLTGYVVTVETLTPHFRVPGGNVWIQGVTSPAVLNGAFTVLDPSLSGVVLTSVKFCFRLDADPGSWSRNNFEFLGVYFNGPGAPIGTAAIVEGNRIFNCFYGYYHDTFNTRDQVIRNNWYRGVTRGPFEALASLSSGSLIPLQSLTTTAVGSTTALATTTQPHGLLVNDLVIVSGATSDPSLYNGTWTVTAVTSVSFQYDTHENGATGVPGRPAAGSTAYGTYPIPQRILASPSPLTSAEDPPGSGRFVATATVALSMYVNGHGMSPGEIVFISKASRSQYNGYFLITEIPPPPNDKTTFKFVLGSNPGGDSTTGYFGRDWTAGREVVENNIIETVPAQTNFSSPTAARWEYTDPTRPVRSLGIQMRRNLIRHVDGRPDLTLPNPNNRSGGIYTVAGAAVLDEENVLDLAAPQPVQFSNCATAKFFANQSPSGQVIRGFDAGLGAAVADLSDEVSDAETLSI